MSIGFELAKRTRKKQTKKQTKKQKQKQNQDRRNYIILFASILAIIFMAYLEFSDINEQNIMTENVYCSIDEDLIYGLLFSSGIDTLIYDCEYKFGDWDSLTNNVLNKEYCPSLEYKTEITLKGSADNSEPTIIKDQMVIQWGTSSITRSYEAKPMWEWDIEYFDSTLDCVLY